MMAVWSWKWVPNILMWDRKKGKRGIEGVVKEEEEKGEEEEEEEKG